MFPAFIIIASLSRVGVNGVVMFISGAMAIEMAAIGILEPNTRDRALEDISR